MKYFMIFCIISLLAACTSSNQFSKPDVKRFEKSKVIMTFKSISDLNDSYFSIRENDYFEFYKELYDSIKNTVYRGKFSRSGDTMILHFQDSKGEELLGNKALISGEKKEIHFFNSAPEARIMHIFN